MTEDPCPPKGASIYTWMYRQGLKGRKIEDVVSEVYANGHFIRGKDEQNFWNGVHNRQLYQGSQSALMIPSELRSKTTPYSDYPIHPYLDQPEIANRWVPMDKNMRPMIRWSLGCMSLSDAQHFSRVFRGKVVKSKYVSENLKGTKLIAIDVDGDHEGELDIDVIEAFAPLMDLTASFYKRDIVLDHVSPDSYDLKLLALPTSYHLIFSVDRLIPTMHFPEAHIDIVGNTANSLRHCKNKIYNGLKPSSMTDEIWNYMLDYIERRKG